MTNMPASDVEPVMRAAREAVAAAIAQRIGAVRTRIAVALSGGRDSIVLLDALARLAPEFGVALSAMHVHHGLSPRADAWAAFCADECAKRGTPFALHRVRVEPKGGASLEATARAARYVALSSADADFIALAHHADDQAETLLLQLLRGAGPHGLAAMPVHRRMPSGASLLRPFLALPRAAIDAYAADRGLAWVDDESNANTDMKRNFIRHEIATRLASAFPGYPATLARGAAHQAEAVQLLDELALLDGEGAIDRAAPSGAALDRSALIALAARAPHRAKNLLRWFLRQHDLRPPSAARLAAMLEQLTHAASDACVRLAHGGAELGIHRGRIVVHPPAIAPFAIAWQGEEVITLPHGTLEFASCSGAGIARAALDGGGVTVQTRAGGERIRLADDRPRQALKRVLQDAGMPPWQRESLPLVFCGDALAAVPGIGVDSAFQAAAGAPGCTVLWRPREPER
jgi:tRNA(Ile)-lysidine synthase